MNDRRPLDTTESGELRRLVRAALTTRDAAVDAEDALLGWIRSHTQTDTAPVSNGHAVTRADLAKPDRLLTAVGRTSAAIATGALPHNPSAEAIRHYLHVAPALAREVREAVRRMGTLR